jgi:hypothetical protein
MAMMTTSPKRPARSRPNPFYVLLVLASTLFVVTALMYCISPMDLQRPGKHAASEWIDRHGPLALGVEFAVMFCAGVLAMATDRWFTAASLPKPDSSLSRGGPDHGAHGREGRDRELA